MKFKKGDKIVWRYSWSKWYYDTIATVHNFPGIQYIEIAASEAWEFKRGTISTNDEIYIDTTKNRILYELKR